LVGVGVFVAVVPAAGEGEPVDVGRSVAERPPVDMVHLALRAGDLTTLDRTGGVERFQDTALGRGGEPFASSQVQRVVSAPQDEG
jgi:hypothetical protein